MQLLIQPLNVRHAWVITSIEPLDWNTISCVGCTFNVALTHRNTYKSHNIAANTTLLNVDHRPACGFTYWSLAEITTIVMTKFSNEISWPVLTCFQTWYGISDLNEDNGRLPHITAAMATSSLWCHIMVMVSNNRLVICLFISCSGCYMRNKRSVLLALCGGNSRQMIECRGVIINLKTI